jgi:hypothetical protein
MSSVGILCQFERSTPQRYREFFWQMLKLLEWPIRIEAESLWVLKLKTS